jgi:aspartyl protease family protein
MTHRILFAAALAAASAGANATDVNVIGLFPGKAVVVIDRGAPRTLSVGQRTAEGVLLVEADSGSAVLEIDGKRQRYEMGQHFETAAMTGARNSVTLAADERGHFVADGAVNGGHIRFLVDTGATMVSLSSADASRLGIDYRSGVRGYTVVADGRRVPTYRVMLESVSIGDLELINVEATVRDAGGPALLGNSFLNRTEMRRDGQSLTLTKRF